MRKDIENREPSLIIERTGYQLRALLNRPECANSLSSDLVEQMHEALDDKANAALHLLTIEGRGKHFCAGFDLSEIDTQSDGDLLLRFVRVEMLLQRIYHAPFPTIATAHGHTVGAGADLFCACEIRIASEDAVFRMPGWHFGVALGTRRLASRVGKDVARSLLSGATLFDASTALQMGFVTRIASACQWPTIIANELNKRSQFHRSAYSDLVRATVTDTREADLASLIETASRPELGKRIKAFIATKRENRVRLTK